MGTGGRRMRRKRGFKRGRVVSLLVAGGVGYAVGVWNPAALRSTDLSAAQTVSLRFPMDSQDAPAAETASDTVTATASARGAGLQFALLSPEPMVPHAAAPA